MTQPFAFLHTEVLTNPTALRLAITEAYRRDEAQAVNYLLDQLPEFDHTPIQTLAKKLVKDSSIMIRIST